MLVLPRPFLLTLSALHLLFHLASSAPLDQKTELSEDPLTTGPRDSSSLLLPRSSSRLLHKRHPYDFFLNSATLARLSVGQVKEEEEKLAKEGGAEEMAFSDGGKIADRNPEED